MAFVLPEAAIGDAFFPAQALGGRTCVLRNRRRL
jgi:hypothetical protein